jgi:hypothetical protein
VLGIEGVERSITWGCGDVGRRGWVSLVGMVGMVGWQGGIISQQEGGLYGDVRGKKRQYIKSRLKY